MKKYELTGETRKVGGHTLHRIRAMRDFGNVLKGDLGGWIESESNLSQDGKCWVSGNAKVYGDAKVSGDARVGGNAEVYDNARVYGNAAVYGDAKVSGDAHIATNADYAVYKNTWSSGRWITYTRSNKMWKAGCFHGTGDELVKKAYADSELSGNCYKAIVEAQEYVDRVLRR